jgi:hypothetical protein
VEELCKAFGQVKNQPTAIIAKTFKGRGIPSKEVLILCLELSAPAQHMRQKEAEAR